MFTQCLYVIIAQERHLLFGKRKRHAQDEHALFCRRSVKTALCQYESGQDVEFGVTVLPVLNESFLQTATSVYSIVGVRWWDLEGNLCTEQVRE